MLDLHTDTDVLFVACMMAQKLCDRNIYIKYNVSGLSPSYICCKQLFNMMGNDVDPNLASIIWNHSLH